MVLPFAGFMADGANERGREFKEFRNIAHCRSRLEEDPRRGTRKNSPLRSSMLETERETIFYCNSRKAILTRDTTLAPKYKQNAVLQKAFCTPCFFSKKRAVLRSLNSGRYSVARPTFRRAEESWCYSPYSWWYGELLMIENAR